MNYEQRYKEALKAVKELQEANPSDDGIKNWVEEKFPELKESGDYDERIRKALIDGFKRYDYGALFNGCFVREILPWLEKQGHTDGIIEKAKTEKQRVIITETDGNANIDWDTRSLQDVKLLLEYGLDYINKLDEKNCLSNTKHSMGDLKIISSLKDIIYGYWNSLPDSALEENEVAESCYRWLEKQCEQNLVNKVEPKFHKGD